MSSKRSTDNVGASKGFKQPAAAQMQSAAINKSVRSMINAPGREGNLTRKLLTWKTPNFGYVQMYINPQEMSISDKKVHQYTRTKAGFVYQYAGEDLTNISIRGTTGSAGIEGINILHNVYRAEQSAFNVIADSLEQTVTTAQITSLFRGVLGSTGFSFNNPLGNILSELGAESLANMFSQPFPSLASLAANVELIFHDVTYRGFFNDFQVTESAQSPGLFEYSLSFSAYAKQGIRANFMPWHRQPVHGADSDDESTLSFDYAALDAELNGSRERRDAIERAKAKAALKIKAQQEFTETLVGGVQEFPNPESNEAIRGVTPRRSTAFGRSGNSDADLRDSEIQNLGSDLRTNAELAKLGQDLKNKLRR